MKKNHCCICGVARNCAMFLPFVFKNMEKIGALFEKYIIILVVDDSIDNTINVVSEYATNNPDHVLLYINKTPLTDIRTVNIAHARNLCLYMMKHAFSDWEYFIMMDCDDINAGQLNTTPLENHLTDEKTELWDALSFHREPYYDTWALSIYPYVFSKSHFINGHQKWLSYYYNILSEALQKDNPENSLISVYSAFNGFAIYKMELFIKCTYDGTFRLDYIPFDLLKDNIQVAGKIMTKGFTENGDCEHRSFHFQAVLKYQAKIRISPQILFSSSL